MIIILQPMLCNMIYQMIQYNTVTLIYHDTIWYCIMKWHHIKIWFCVILHVTQFVVDLITKMYLYSSFKTCWTTCYLMGTTSSVSTFAYV